MRMIIASENLIDFLNELKKIIYDSFYLGGVDFSESPIAFLTNQEKLYIIYFA